MEGIEFSFDITKKMYIDLYRTHVKYKFKLHRSMIMSVLLLVFGLTMQYVFKMDFSFINMIVFWITVAAIIMNLLSDYVLPKTAYNNLILNHNEKGSIIGRNDGFDIKLSQRTDKKLWKDFDSVIETDLAFLLYKRDTFIVILKNNNYVDDMRNLFKKHINQDKNILYKR